MQIGTTLGEAVCVKNLKNIQIFDSIILFLEIYPEQIKVFVLEIYPEQVKVFLKAKQMYRVFINLF